MSWARQLYERIFYTAALLYFGLGGLVITALGWVAYRFSRSRANQLRGRRVISAAFRGFLSFLRASGLVKCDTAALDALKSQRGLVLAPNHPSLLDAVIILAQVPEAVCILKAGLLRSPFLGGGARWAGYISNDGGASLIRRAAAELRAGGQLLVFPEGTRTHSEAPGGLNPCKGAFALAAREAQAPVQVIVLRYDPPLLGKGRPLFATPRFPLTIRAELGPLLPPPAPHEEVRSWMAEVEAWFRQTLSTPRQ